MTYDNGNTAALAITGIRKMQDSDKANSKTASDHNPENDIKNNTGAASAKEQTKPGLGDAALKNEERGA